MPKPIPDWQRHNVFLVDPAIWSRYRCGKSDLRPVHADLIHALGSIGVEPCILNTEDQPVDIWIRDWGFVEGAYFKFPPSYGKKLYSPKAVSTARAHLDKKTGVCRRTIPLVLDGGNLIHNGKIAILTKKIIADNLHVSSLEIERTIISLGFERVIFIPFEPEDVIGHADGILSFPSPNVLLVNDYNGEFFTDYRRDLLNALKRANLNLEIIPFPWFTTDEMNDGVWSAVGCYINFLQTAKGIVVPAFENQKDDQAVEILKTATAFPIRSVKSTTLAREGGVLNCMTLGFEGTKLR